MQNNKMKQLKKKSSLQLACAFVKNEVSFFTHWFLVQNRAINNEVLKPRWVFTHFVYIHNNTTNGLKIPFLHLIPTSIF